MRPTTIRSSREIDRIFREGARSSSRSLVVLASKTPQERGPSGRVAFIAGTKLGGSVERNRLKRLLREAARDGGGPWAGWDVVLVARSGAQTSSVSQIGGDLVAQLRSLKVLP